MKATKYIILLFAFCVNKATSQVTFPDKFPVADFSFINMANKSEKYLLAKEELKAFLFFDIKTEPNAEIMYNGVDYLFEKTNMSIFPIYFSGELVKKRSPEFSKKIPTQLYRTLYKSDFNFFNFKEEDLPILVIYNNQNELCGVAKNLQQISLINCGKEKKEPSYLMAKILQLDNQQKVVPYAQQVIAVINKKTNDTIAKPSTNKFGDFSVRLEAWQEDYIVKLNNEDVKSDSLLLNDVRGQRVGAFKKNNDNYEILISKKDLVELSDVNFNNEDLSLNNSCLVKNNCNTFDIVGNVKFDDGETGINNSSKMMLNTLIDFLKKNSKYKLTINNFVGFNVNAEQSKIITAKRAELITDYMVIKGINKNRITATGLGNIQPRNRCSEGVQCSDAEFNYNARTEFKFYK